jgi:uncharacterized protein YkwD
MAEAVVVLIVLVALAGLVVALVRAPTRSTADILDWKPRSTAEQRQRADEDDLEQLLEARNERRRRAGAPELTVDEVRAEVAAAELEHRGRAERWRAEARRPPPPDAGDEPS